MPIAQAFTDLRVSARSQAKLGMHIIYLSSEASACSRHAFTKKVLFSSVCSDFLGVFWVVLCCLWVASAR